MKADIATEAAVNYARANASKTYTMLYVSSESHTDPARSWPDNLADGLVHIHWAVGDITAETLTGEGDVTKATPLHADDWPRHGPSPTQPYIFYLLEHEGPTPDLSTTHCWPDVNLFCAQSDFKAWLAAQPWTLVATNYLVGVYYNDTFRT